MPYKFLPDIATADIAFEAWGQTLEEMFLAACDALLNVMVENFHDISRQSEKQFSFHEESLEMLLFQLLQEIVFFKDAEELLLRIERVEITQTDKRCSLKAWAYGEPINPDRHHLNVDIKAITLHRLKIKKTSEGFRCTVVPDI